MSYILYNIINDIKCQIKNIYYIGNTIHPQPSVSNAFTYRGSDIQPQQDVDHIVGVGSRHEGGLGDGLVIMYFYKLW